MGWTGIGFIWEKGCAIGFIGGGGGGGGGGFTTATTVPRSFATCSGGGTNGSASTNARTSFIGSGPHVICETAKPRWDTANPGGGLEPFADGEEEGGGGDLVGGLEDADSEEEGEEEGDEDFPSRAGDRVVDDIDRVEHEDEDDVGERDEVGGVYAIDAIDDADEQGEIDGELVKDDEAGPSGVRVRFDIRFSLGS
ncbi:hypothetical protein CC2G_009712 [Coprinopsis cinerea AmutBmut pab1-1]|nr:hypothetical protein CC2G_009712 [Coprinopsis cinerea AmutBmut pab1-1]